MHSMGLFITWNSACTMPEHYRTPFSRIHKNVWMWLFAVCLWTMRQTNVCRVNYSRATKYHVWIAVPIKFFEQVDPRLVEIHIPCQFPQRDNLIFILPKYSNTVYLSKNIGNCILLMECSTRFSIFSHLLPPTFPTTYQCNQKMN